jgi:hypothetical protein
MNKKFELTKKTKEVGDHKLYQIKALINIRDGVKAGDLGGWVEEEKNLGCDKSHRASRPSQTQPD